MKVSFDGARMNLLRNFNDLAKTELDEEQKEIMHSLRDIIVGLLCMYDDSGGCNCLIDNVKVAEIQ